MIENKNPGYVFREKEDSESLLDALVKLKKLYSIAPGIAEEVTGEQWVD